VWGGTKPLLLTDDGLFVDPLDEGGAHELSHGIVGEQMGLDVLSYKLWRTKTSLGVEGVTYFAGEERLLNEEQLRAHMCVCVAGQEGAAHLFVTVYGFDPAEAMAKAAIGSGTDLADFKKWARYIDFPERAARLEARRIIKAHWSRILRGAARLADKGKLNPGSV
jgi:hypothetical protein